MYSEYIFYEPKQFSKEEVRIIYDNFSKICDKKSLYQYYTIDDSQIIRTFYSIEDFEDNYRKEYQWLSLLLTDKAGRRLKINTKKVFVEVYFTLDNEKVIKNLKSSLEQKVNLKIKKYDDTLLRSYCNETRRYVKRDISLGLIGKIREKYFDKVEIEEKEWIESFTIETIDQIKRYVDFSRFASNITSNYLSFRYECKMRDTRQSIPYLIVNISPQWIEINTCLKEDKLPEIFSEFENILKLELLSKIIIPRSVFIAYVFNKWEEAFVSKLTRFFQLLQFNVLTGRLFSPEPVDEKIKRWIESQGIFVAVITKDIETKEGKGLPSIWLQQEPIIALLKNKKVMLIKENNIDVNLGYFDKYDFIPMDKDKVDEVFLKIMEGLLSLGFQL
jgi:hypothetical protein